MEESRTEDKAASGPPDQTPNLLELVKSALEGIDAPGPCVGDDGGSGDP